MFPLPRSLPKGWGIHFGTCLSICLGGTSSNFRLEPWCEFILFSCSLFFDSQVTLSPSPKRKIFPCVSTPEAEIQVETVFNNFCTGLGFLAMIDLAYQCEQTPLIRGLTFGEWPTVWCGGAKRRAEVPCRMRGPSAGIWLSTVVVANDDRIGFRFPLGWAF